MTTATAGTAPRKWVENEFIMPANFVIFWICSVHLSVWKTAQNKYVMPAFNSTTKSEIIAVGAWLSKMRSTWSFHVVVCIGQLRNVWIMITHVHSQPIVWWRFRCRCRCRLGLLKLSIDFFLASMNLNLLLERWKRYQFLLQDQAALM